jgi:hypothetical protein
LVTNTLAYRSTLYISPTVVSSNFRRVREERKKFLAGLSPTIDLAPFCRQPLDGTQRRSA